MKSMITFEGVVDRGVAARCPPGPQASHWQDGTHITLMKGKKNKGNGPDGPF